MRRIYAGKVIVKCTEVESIGRHVRDIHLAGEEEIARLQLADRYILIVMVPAPMVMTVSLPLGDNIGCKAVKLAMPTLRRSMRSASLWSNDPPL